MPNYTLTELLRRGIFDCIFNLHGSYKNTVGMVQLIFADMYASWTQKHADDRTPDEEMRYQFGVNELEKIMNEKKEKNVEEIFQLLGDLTMCDISESKECMFWFIECYILTNIPQEVLSKYYGLLTKIALAYTELCTSPIIRVTIISNS